MNIRAHGRVIQKEQTHRATLDNSHAPTKALNTRVDHHIMPEQQLKTPTRSDGKDTEVVTCGRGIKKNRRCATAHDNHGLIKVLNTTVASHIMSEQQLYALIRSNGNARDWNKTAESMKV
jgi:hypothetical protein